MLYMECPDIIQSIGHSLCLLMAAAEPLIPHTLLLPLAPAGGLAPLALQLRQKLEGGGGGSSHGWGARRATMKTHERMRRRRRRRRTGAQELAH